MRAGFLFIETIVDGTQISTDIENKHLKLRKTNGVFFCNIVYYHLENIE